MVIVPNKEYDRPLQEAIVLLDDRILVYELSLGLMANLRSKAELYCEHKENAEMYDEKSDRILFCTIETDQNGNYPMAG